MKNKELFILTLVMAMVFGVMIPLINKSENKRAQMPDLVQDFIAVSTDTEPPGEEPVNPGNVTLPESAYGRIMDYINYKGRSWDKQEHKDDLFGGKKYYRVDVSISQSFFFAAQPADDGSLELYFEDRANWERAQFVTKLKSEIANALLQLLEGK